MAGDGGQMDIGTVETPSFLFPSVLESQQSDVTVKVGEREKTYTKLSGFSSFKKADTDEDVKKYCQESEVKATISPDSHSYVDNDSDSFSEVEIIYSQSRKRLASSSDTDTEARKNKKKKKKEKKKKKKKKKQSGKSDKASKYDKKKPDTIWLEETTLKADEAFRFDKRQCKENLLFDSLYRLDVANYQRKHDIACLGLRKDQSFEWTDQRSTRKKGKTSSMKRRYFISSKQENANTNDEKEVNIAIFDNSENSLALLKGGRQSPTALEDISASGADTFSQRTEFLNRSLRADPRKVDLWIQLASLQDSAFQDKSELEVSSTFSAQLNTNRSHRAIVEKKLQILDRAVSSNPNSLLLITEYMECCREISDFAETSKKWTQFTFKNPNMGILWAKYITFLQSNLSNFSTSAVISAYHKCFKTMQAISDGTIKTHKCEADHGCNMLSIFVQFCQFLFQADLPEKAVACMQAMIEFNCFAPKDLDKVQPSGQKAFFEAFWDSEVPRFGEETASGWESWMENQKNQMDGKQDSGSQAYCAQDSVEEDDIDKEILDIAMARPMNWLIVENKRRSVLWKPLRHNEDSDDYVDTDRMVLADDVIPCLFKLESEEDITCLVLAHLAFLGIPVKIDFLRSTFWKKLLDLGFTPEYLKMFSNVNGSEFVCLCPISRNSKMDRFEGHRVSYAEEVILQSLKLAEKFSRNFSNTISQCLLLFKVMCIKEELQNNDSQNTKDAVKRTRKFAKSLLKQAANRNCLELWQIFAYFEYDFGSHDEALRILDMVISMCITEGHDEISKFSWVFRDYAGFLMRSVEHGAESASQLENKAVNLLLLQAQDSPMPSSAISTEKAHPLRIRRIREGFKEIFTRIIDDFRSQQTSKINIRSKLEQHKFEWVLCYALLEFLTGTVRSSNSVLEELQDSVQLSAKQSLEVTRLKVAMLEYTRAKLCTGVSELRKALWGAVESFPSDLELNEKLLHMENKSIASLQIRSHFHRVLANANTILLWTLAIGYEEERLKKLKMSLLLEDVSLVKDTVLTVLPTSGIVNRIRSLYARATTSRAGRSCVSLWRRFFKFEVQNGDARRSKNVFYAALQNCPWSKDIYLDAIQAHEEEFENIMDIMQEKEIRIRLPVEELGLLLEEQS